MNNDKLLDSLNVVRYKCDFKMERVFIEISKNFEFIFLHNNSKVPKEIKYKESVLDEYKKYINCQIRNSIKKRESYELHYIINDGNNNPVRVIDKGIPYYENNAFKYIEGLILKLKESPKYDDQISVDINNQFEQILDHLPGAVFYKDKKNNFIRVNKYVAKQFGLTKNELIGKNLSEIYDQEIAESYFKDDLEVIESGTSKENILESWPTKTGLKWVNTSKIPFKNDRQEIIGIVGISFDLTQLINAQREKNIYMQIVEQSPAAVVMTDTEGNITYVNQSFEKITGYSKSEVIGKNPRILNKDDNFGTDFKILWENILNGKSWQGIFQNINKEGKIYWEDATIFPIIENEEVIKLVGIKYDITEKYLQDLKIKNLYIRDQLTGAFNRRGFLELANKEFEQIKRYSGESYLCMLDLDHFKNVNDVYGHKYGDEVLQAFTKACKRTIRKSDILGRVGGEEFSILLVNISFEQTIKVLERLREAVQLLEVRTKVGDVIKVTVSIGFTKAKENAKDIYELLNKADVALYQAKSNGRNRVEFNKS